MPFSHNSPHTHLHFFLLRNDSGSLWDLEGHWSLSQLEPSTFLRGISLHRAELASPSRTGPGSAEGRASILPIRLWGQCWGWRSKLSLLPKKSLWSTCLHFPTKFKKECRKCLEASPEQNTDLTPGLLKPGFPGERLPVISLSLLPS